MSNEETHNDNMESTSRSIKVGVADFEEKIREY